MTLCIDAGVTESINPTKCITLEIGVDIEKRKRYAAWINNTLEYSFFKIYWRRFQEAQSLLLMQNRIAGNRLEHIVCLQLHITYRIVAVMVSVHRIEY